MKRFLVLALAFVLLSGCGMCPTPAPTPTPSPLPPGPTPVPVPVPPSPVPTPIPPEPDGGARSYATYQALADALAAGHPPTITDVTTALGKPYSDYVQADPPHHRVQSWHVRATTGSGTLAVHGHSLDGTILSFVVE